MRRQGFTLVEMLVVIGIIAVLGAILFPVYSQARENGRKANCLSNLRQIGQAVRMYSEDSGGFLPIANSQPSVDGPPSIADVLSSYSRDSRIFRCPSDKSGKWQSEGTSYDYGFGLLGVGMRPQRADRPYRQDATKFPLAGDFEKGWHTSGINVLFADGHVDNINY